MLLKILATGSKGNCAVLKDEFDNELMIDCGIRYERIVTQIDFAKLGGILVTHEHNDHSCSMAKFKMTGVEMHTYENMEDGKSFTIDKTWRIMPISVEHTTDTFAFIIVNIKENKKIFWATDLKRLPKIAESNYDLMAIEVNWDGDTLMEKIKYEPNSINPGHNNHLSLEKVSKWLDNRVNKPQTILALHPSNSGLLDEKRVVGELSQFGQQVLVAKKELRFYI